MRMAWWLSIVFLVSTVAATAGASKPRSVEAFAEQGTDVGVLTTNGRPVVLAHIDPVRRLENCQRSGRVYPCGHYGWQTWWLKTANQAVQCQIVGQDGGTDLGLCRLPDGTDLGLWLIEYGFARALPGAPESYQSAHSASAAANKGIFSRP